MLKTHNTYGRKYTIRDWFIDFYRIYLLGPRSIRGMAGLDRSIRGWLYGDIWRRWMAYRKFGVKHKKGWRKYFFPHFPI